MSSDPGNTNGRPPGPPRRPPTGAQGASRGGRRPEETENDPDREPASGGSGQPPFGGYPFNQGRRPGSGWSGGGASSGPKRGGATFLGLPVGLIYAIGIAIVGLVIFGAVCGKPSATGSVAGQVKALNADRSIATVAGAQVVVRGANQTYTATTTDVPADAEGEAAYNYRIENVPPGNYTMAVTPPAGATLQPEQDISFKVESGQLFPQSVLLLAQGIQKPVRSRRTSSSPARPAATSTTVASASSIAKAAASTPPTRCCCTCSGATPVASATATRR